MGKLGPLLAVVLVVIASACGGGGGTKTTESETISSETTASGQPGLDPAKSHQIVIETNKGSFTIELDVKDSPKTTASFVALARKGFFDGTIFHRIVPGFVIQGGDPTGTGSGGPGYTTVDPPPADTRYVKGVVAMAKTEAEPPGTAGSQFFVVTAADAGLPPEYALLGKVVKGLDVVEQIGTLGDANQQPTERVEIKQATVREPS